MKFYWNCDTHGRPKKKQALYCIGIYKDFMILSTYKKYRLKDEVVKVFIDKYNGIIGKYQTHDHIFYGELDKSTNVFIEFLKD